MNTKSILVGLVAVLVLFLGVTLPRSGGTVAERIVEKTVGAVATLDGVNTPNVNINGVEELPVSQAINATSTMLCNIKNPYTSTSTLSSFSVRITDGILGANNVTVSTSSSYYGSSTPVLVLDRTIPTNSIDAFVWFPSSATTTTRVLPGINSTNGESNVLIKAGEYVVLRVSTSTAAGAMADYYDGQCSAVFRRL